MNFIRRILNGAPPRPAATQNNNNGLNGSNGNLGTMNGAIRASQPANEPVLPSASTVVLNGSTPPDAPVDPVIPLTVQQTVEVLKVELDEPQKTAEDATAANTPDTKALDSNKGDTTPVPTEIAVAAQTEHDADELVMLMDDENTQPTVTSSRVGMVTQRFNDSMDEYSAPPVTRTLTPIEINTKPSRHIIYGVNSDIGMVRNNNQDACYAMVSNNMSVETMPEFGLFVVADGMGGYHDGEKASAMTTRTIARHLLNSFYNKVLNVEEDRPLISEVLTEAVHRANDEISRVLPEGGTTVTAIAIVNNLAYIAHVGDSRAYLINGDGIEKLTRDHSLVERLIELQQITHEEAAHHPQRNVLYRALGQSDVVEVDAMTRKLSPGVKLLICSDGLWGLVPDQVIYSLIVTSTSPQEATDALIQAANQNGGPDNITAVVIQLPG